ncbi:MAG TPA: tetratricopeptide repeat protein [bacterium]|nr:tetratricopeptide repeat protein [bacterium]
MLPIVLGAGVALLAFLSGCTDRQNINETKQPKPIGAGGAGPQPPSSADASAPAKPANYFASFGNNIRAAEMYQRLTEKGVSNEALDQGCPLLFDHYVPQPQMAKDRRIEACEVLNYGLARYREYPEAVMAITDKPIPWTIDDGDAATKQDEYLRASVQEKIDYLEKQPALLAYEKGSEEYRKRLGTALSFYVDFPNLVPVILARREELREKSKVLVEWGLQEFQAKILQDGGLGGVHISQNAGQGWVGSAVEAWDSQVGGPSARVKLLYAVLAQADIDPVFVLSTAKSNADLIEVAPEAQSFLLSFGGRKSEYLQVGISLNSTDPQTKHPGLVRFEGLHGVADPFSENHIQELSLAAYLAMDLHEKGDFFMLHGNGDPIPFYRGALNIAPTDSAIYNSIAILLEKMGGPDYARTAYKEALRLDPKNGSAAYNLGQLYQRQEKFEEAIHAFSIPAHGSSLPPNRLETTAPAVQKVLAKDPNNPDALALDSKLKALSEKNPATDSVVQ